MTEQERQKLCKKLAKWAGFTINKQNLGRGSEHLWIYPDNNVGTLPDFTQSQDACTKHLVPKVLKEHAIIETYSFKQASGLYYSETEIWDRGCRDSSTVEVLKCKSVGKAFVQDFDLDKTNALSLCLAIEKLIDGGKQ